MEGRFRYSRRFGNGNSFTGTFYRNTMFGEGEFKVKGGLPIRVAVEDGRFDLDVTCDDFSYKGISQEI